MSILNPTIRNEREKILKDLVEQLKRDASSIPINAETIASVTGYKNGEGGAMKGVMKPIASGLSEVDLKAVAATIASFK